MQGGLLDIKILFVHKMRTFSSKGEMSENE